MHNRSRYVTLERPDILQCQNDNPSSRLCRSVLENVLVCTGWKSFLFKYRNLSDTSLFYDLKIQKDGTIELRKKVKSTDK